jgi:ribonuclease HI
MKLAKVWTDGSISKNPGGDMGWAARIELHAPEYTTSLSGPLVVHTWSRRDAALENTNQVAEMLAIRAALLVLQDHRGADRLELTSDSQWCIMQLRRRQIIAAGLKPWQRVAYVKEWAEIETLCDIFPEQEYIHTRGHMRTNDWRNEECDKLATAARAGGVPEAKLASILSFGKEYEQRSAPVNSGSEGSPAIG